MVQGTSKGMGKATRGGSGSSVCSSVRARGLRHCMAHTAAQGKNLRHYMDDDLLFSWLSCSARECLQDSES
jgi:hypothetical protein